MTGIFGRRLIGAFLLQARRTREVAGQVNLHLAVGAGQARIGRTEQRQRRHIQRSGQMAQAGIHRHAGLRASQHLANTGQVQFGQHFGVFETGSDALGPGFLLRIAPRQLDPDAKVSDPFGQLAPVSFRPVLGVPGSTMQKHHVRILARQFHQALDIQAVVTQAFGQVIAQRDGEQLTHSLHRVLPAGNGQASIVKARSDGFACRVFIEAGHRRLDVTGQPGAFQQALGVDHQVIFRGANALLEALPLTALDGLPDVFAPATDRHRNHLAHRRMPGRDLGKAFFHHPVEFDAGDRPRRVGQRRQRMNDVAQRRSLDQQNPQAI
ncbi:hypothetical protein D3C71_918410 [compost metagenome]